MNISIVGTGYVGLVTGSCLAERGHNVTCIDVRPEVVAEINAGRPTIHEIGLDELLRTIHRNGTLLATTDTHSAIHSSEVTLICVGTPTVDGRMDISQIVAAAEAIGEALSSKSAYHVVAVKSTVLPGTTEGPVKEAIERRSGKKAGDGWGLCMNPEFLREGRAVEDFRSPDRVVVGATDKKTADNFLKVYADFSCPKLVTTLRTAEMIKYVSNSLLATLISFSNEIGNLCSEIPGLDAREVWKGVHLDRRLTPVDSQQRGPARVTEYIWHGLGFGGSCFPKDVAAIRTFAHTLGAKTRILNAVLDINEEQPRRMVALLEKEMSLLGKRVAVLGLAFKPSTDDLRESPALPLIAELLKKKVATVVAHDPIAMPHARTRPEFANVCFANNWKEALQDCDACCVVTSWPEYVAISPGEFAELMRNPLVVDGRGMYDPVQFANVGVTWRGIGYTPEAFEARPHYSLFMEDGKRQESRDECMIKRSSTDGNLEAMIVRDQDGTIRYWSKEAELIYGWTPEEVLGARTHHLFKTQFPAPLAAIENKAREEETWQGRLIHTRRDGALVTVQSHWKIQHNPKNRSVTVIEINVESAA